MMACTRVAHEGGFHLDGDDAVKRRVGDVERELSA
jgi:hypothetical protein